MSNEKLQWTAIVQHSADFCVWVFRVWCGVSSWAVISHVSGLHIDTLTIYCHCIKWLPCHFTVFRGISSDQSIILSMFYQQFFLLSFDNSISHSSNFLWFSDCYTKKAFHGYQSRKKLLLLQAWHGKNVVKVEEIEFFANKKHKHIEFEWPILVNATTTKHNWIELYSTKTYGFI